MGWILNQIRQEPVLFQGLLQASIALVTAFGFKLEPEAIGAILAFTAALLSFATRTQVTPNANPRTPEGTPLVPAVR